MTCFGQIIYAEVSVSVFEPRPQEIVRVSVGHFGLRKKYIKHDL